MAYLKSEVQEKIVNELEQLRYKAHQEVRRNIYTIKNLAREQAILKRSAKHYTNLIYSMKYGKAGVK